jgi:CelD/BcsL family acetyltransferase involved in cellulose biosynthesis
MLDEMAMLHQTAWEARGEAGCFARPFFRRFHRALIERALGRGEVALLRVSGGGVVIGILYNFQFRGEMLAYQSGFSYRGAEKRAKPGLTCHHAGVRFALEQGCEVYDFLAGEGRYKRSLADGGHRQTWVETGPFWSVRLLLRVGMAGWRGRVVSGG